ncbi:hypothetical protein EI94DRAFT_1813455 [Lactarius quietus]|nr:hypothetical protein EI94DRAFT_1813455 [Lactarius quietus]
MSDAEDIDLGADGGDSDSSSHYDPQEMPVLSNVQLDTSELRKALKDAQLKYQSLFHRYKALQTKYNASKSTKSVHMKKGRRSMLSGKDKEIMLARGRFSFTFELWVDDPVFERDCPSGLDPLNPKRYRTKHTEELAITAELYSSLPLHLQEALADPRRQTSFKKIFPQQVKQEHANTVHTARLIASKIFNLSPVYFRSQFDHANIPELQELLTDTCRPLEKYPRWPAMLFPNRDCENTNAFAVEELPKFLKTILHRVSLLGSDPAGRCAPRASLWGITKMTPGMIALAATIICHIYCCALPFPAELDDPKLTFVCGPNQVFSEKSKGPSNVSWRERFQDYKQAILQFPPQYISFLLSWYDHRIFPAKSVASTSANSTLTSQQGPNDIDNLIRCMMVNIDVGQSLCAPAIPQVQLTRSPLAAVEAEPAPPAQANAHPSEQHEEAVNTPTDTAVTKRVSKGVRAMSAGSRKTRSGNSKAQLS